MQKSNCRDFFIAMFLSHCRSPQVALRLLFCTSCQRLLSCICRMANIEKILTDMLHGLQERQPNSIQTVSKMHRFNGYVARIKQFTMRYAVFDDTNCRFEETLYVCRQAHWQGLGICLLLIVVEHGAKSFYNSAPIVARRWRPSAVPSGSDCASALQNKYR